MVKGFNLPITFVLYEISYVNVLMYGAVLPNHKSRDDKKDNEQDVIDANDPKNEEKIRQFLLDSE